MAVADTIAETDWVRPEHLWIPDRVSSVGAQVVDFAADCGMELDEPQQLVLDGFLSLRPDGKWSAFEAAIIAARQNLKTFVLMALVLAKLYLFDDRLIIWSAHEFATSEEAFRDLEMRIMDHAHLRRRVKRVSHENGKEGIELHGDRRIRFRARTKTGGRGLTGDTVILDEAMKLAAASMGSLVPTMLARQNPQLIYGASAGDPGADVLRAVRDRGRRGGDPTLAYAEWCAPPSDCADKQCDHQAGVAVGCALDDMALVRRANPALGVRILVSTIKAVRLALPPAEFARECLGWWEDPEEASDGLPIEKWNTCKDRESQIVADLVLSIAVAQDLSWSTIASAGVTKDGRVHGEVVEYARGTDWVAARAKALKEEHGAPRIVLAVGGPKTTIGDELAALGIEFEEANGVRLVAACGALEDLMLRGTLVHLGQPELDTAVRHGLRKPVGEAWTWAMRASPVEVSPIVAVTLAVAAVVHTETDDDEAQIY